MTQIQPTSLSFLHWKWNFFYLTKLQHRILNARFFMWKKAEHELNWTELFGGLKGNIFIQVVRSICLSVFGFVIKKESWYAKLAFQSDLVIGGVMLTCARHQPGSFLYYEWKIEIKITCILFISIVWNDSWKNKNCEENWHSFCVKWC